jgi:hypothetical protein
MKSIIFLLALTISGYSYASEASLILEAVSKISDGAKIGTKRIVKSAIKSTDGLPEKLIRDFELDKAEFYLKSKSGRLIVLEKTPERFINSDVIVISSFRKGNAKVAEQKQFSKIVSSELEGLGLTKEVEFDEGALGMYHYENESYYIETVVITKEGLEKMDIGTLQNILEKLSRI